MKAELTGHLTVWVQKKDRGDKVASRIFCLRNWDRVALMK